MPEKGEVRGRKYRSDCLRPDVEKEPDSASIDAELAEIDAWEATEGEG